MRPSIFFFDDDDKDIQIDGCFVGEKAATGASLNNSPKSTNVREREEVRRPLWRLLMFVL